MHHLETLKPRSCPRASQVTGFLGSARCEGVVLDSGARVHLQTVVRGPGPSPLPQQPFAGEEIRPKLGVISSLPPQTFLPLVPPAWETAGFRSLEALKPCQSLGPAWSLGGTVGHGQRAFSQ